MELQVLNNVSVDWETLAWAAEEEAQGGAFLLYSCIYKCSRRQSWWDFPSPIEMGPPVHLLHCRWGGVMALEPEVILWRTVPSGILRAPTVPHSAAKNPLLIAGWNFCEAVERHLSPWLGPSGISHRGDSVAVRGVTAVSLQLTARFSCTVTFVRLFSWWRPSPLSTLALLTEFPLCVFSSCMYWHLLYFLETIRHTSKTHIYQGSQHAIVHLCHKSQCPKLSHGKANWDCTNSLTNVMFGWFVSCFPGRLRCLLRRALPKPLLITG